MITRRTRLFCLVAALGWSCGGGAASDHKGHAVTKGETPAAENTTKAAPSDPHAGHVMPAPPDAGTFDLKLATQPSAPKAGERARLVLDPRSGDGTRVERLAVVHEKPLHLIVVSRDLSYFAHEHPERQTDGTYALDFTFPAAGPYVLFGDFTPEGATGQVVRMPLEVAGAAPPSKPLVADDRGAPKRFGAYEVALAPATITAGAETMLAFTITRAGAPISDLRPYLGALGHCVVIDESATEFLHSHPLEAAGGSASLVQFHTVFPAAGKYKVWGQFDVGGEMLVADFVLDIGAPGGAAAPVADPHAGHPH